MKVSRNYTLFAVILFITVFSAELASQVPVETSKEKMIISGIPYYVHTVRKGQTAYSISKAYNISVDVLTAENPPALYGLKEGQILRIPANSTQTKPFPEAAAHVKDETKYTYHNLKSGDTVYSLSRLYGVSDEEIIQSNPGLDINKLSVGTEIAIPKRDFMTQKQKFNEQETKYIYHKVEKGETLASIARKYNMPLRDLRKENRNMRFPQVGDYVKVPARGLPETKPVEPVAADTIPEQVEEPVKMKERPAGFTQIRNLKGTVNVAVLLPFYLNENSNRVERDSSYVKGKKQYKISRLPEDWIYPGSFDFVEMYNGMLLAADTLRSLGLNININTYDLKQDTVSLTKLIRSGKLSGMDLIIGPVYSHNLQILSDYAASLGIPVVSPVALMSNSVLRSHPTLFMANSSLEVAQRQISKKIAESNTSNLVFIHTDSLGIDPDVKRYKEMIFSDLTGKMPYEDIRFRELIYYPRSAFGNDSINRISHTLSENINNVVIIASEDPAVISETVTIIHGLSRKFNVRVYGYPSMVYIDNLDPRIFFELDQLIFSPYRADFSASNVRQFNLNYRQKFLTMPLEVSYAWIGYDIAYYFISGIAIQGKEFIAHPEIHRPELLQNDFEFERKEPSSGFENQKLFKLRYSRDYVVKTEE